MDCIQEVARSLLDLGVMAPAGNKPTTYPYASHPHLDGPSARSSVKSVIVQLPELKAEEEEVQRYSTTLFRIPHG